MSKPPAKFFIKKLTSQQEALLSRALMKSIFPTPNEGQLLFEDSSSDENDSLIFIFEKQYFDSLYSSIEKAYKAGLFEKSNSEMKWNDFRNAIRSAAGTDNIDMARLTDYWKSFRYYLGSGTNLFD